MRDAGLDFDNLLVIHSQYLRVFSKFNTDQYVVAPSLSTVKSTLEHPVIVRAVISSKKCLLSIRPVGKFMLLVINSSIYWNWQ